jgi:outer membrane receptor for ferrienterochelin and colicin
VRVNRAKGPTFFLNEIKLSHYWHIVSLLFKSRGSMMNNNSTYPRRSFLTFGRAIFATVTLLSMSVAGFAQETTSDIRGTLSGSDGSPASGVRVTVVDNRTSTRASTTTSNTGQFSMTGLRVGGPYSIQFESPEYASQTVTDVFLALGETYTFSLALSDQAVEEIVVTASTVQSVQVAVGPNSTFNFDDLQNLPSINRDIRDIIRLDPRVYIDEAFVDAVQCVGANPRFNSITVDGVRMNDNFGLNSNGYPTQRMPFPFDAIQNVSLELAPYDVQYGGFTACNTNAVTRSGGNEFSARAWFDYTDESMTGDKLEGDPVPQDDFDEKRFGFSVGGPILQDKLFFFAAYEKAETADTFDRCAGDQSCANPVDGVTQAQLDRIANIASTLYNYDPGSQLTSAPNEDEKYLVRLDWNINDNHEASLTYAYNDGFNVSESDTFSGAYEFSNHYYNRGAELKSYAAQLFSDWTDNFSTELRFGYLELDNLQETINNQGFPEVQIETYADGNGDGNVSQALVFLGGDDSRQSNDLNYDTTNFKLAGTYTLGDHIISGGYEFEETNVFNLFVQHTIGEYRFDESNLGDTVGCSFTPGRFDGCIDLFEDFSPDDIYIGNSAGSLNPADSAASFGYSVNSLYIQDEFTLTSTDLTIVAGLRYDWYSSDDLPNENTNFIARSGFSNRTNFDGQSLLQPRLGLNWDVSDTLTLRAGAGLFSGGNPNVWLGNNFQSDGITQVQAREFNGTDTNNLNTTPANLTTIPLGINGTGVPMYDAPQSILDFIQNNPANSSVNALAPDFSPPSNWKFSVGGTYLFDLGPLGDGYVLSADIIKSQSEDSATIVDDTLVLVGTAPDGRPIYFGADKSVAGCAVDPLANPGACQRTGTQDFILANVQGDDAESLSFSFSLSKDYDWGLDWTFGYAYTESEDVNPMTSSVAFSNYNNMATADPNNPGRSISNYEIPTRFILKLGFQREFFGDNTTRFTLFTSRNQGRPYSYTFSNQEMFNLGAFFNPADSRSLLYMPSGPSDPNVIFDPGFDQAAFFAFAEANGLTEYGGGIVPRNEFNSDWWTKMDLRVSQEIPGFGSDQKAQVYFVVENLLNLINDDWGVLYELGFPRTAPIVEANLVDSAGTPNDFSDDQYEFVDFTAVSQTRVGNASLWSLRIGFNYNFN